MLARSTSTRMPASWVAWPWGLIACALVTGCHAEMQVSMQHDVVVYEAPPPRPEGMPRPPEPDRAVVWAAGHWDWNGSRWVWSHGHWERERPGYRYVHARWVRRGKGWVFRKSAWRRERALPDAAPPPVEIPEAPETQP